MAHRIKESAAAGDGERDYVEHVSAQRLSGVERLVVVVALILLGFAGFTAYSDDKDPITTSAIGTPAVQTEPAHPAYDYCREHSPYPEKSC
jgi:hypothetical protein